MQDLPKLHKYAEEGNIKEIRKYMDSPNVINTNLTTLLLLAAFNNRIELMRMLLKDERVDPMMPGIDIFLVAKPQAKAELLLDPRFDWRTKINDIMTQELLKSARNEVKRNLTFGFMALQRVNPKTTIENKEYKVLHENLLKQNLYKLMEEEVCNPPINQLARDRNIPPIYLVALAQVLKIDFDMMDISWSLLCQMVNTKINELVR